MSERAAPFYCPYCGDEDLLPSEEGHGAWECRSCSRAFRLKFLGLLAPGATGQSPSASDGGTS
ncbi:hypothetical protein CP981_30120 [Streptomyces platensis]|uniref:Insertion element protein n=1 Tax=Streptomyces platensis TaxID=58346 RepID=A0AAE6NPN2_STRPT|nr:hypothetical protein [Streptomyces platensis]OSY46547.1 hypothetical protein BG653_01914 [Streptomyces platensis]QEV55326.1 hypothetical protein CP981_30120 [Streptomyces platensis]BCK67743.1 hypothetical protein Srufu_016960 [Streptomyces libani subsp. rufus]